MPTRTKKPLATTQSRSRTAEGFKPRRPRGSGSIRLKGSTHTAIWFTIDPATGKRKQHTETGFHSPADAQAFLNEQLADVQRGVAVADTRLTVRKLIEDHWLPIKASENLATNTVEQYKYGAALVVGTIGALHLSGNGSGVLTPGAAARMVATLTDRKLSARSRQIAVLVLKSSTAWACREKKIPSNPLEQFRGVRAERKGAIKAWDENQLRQFLAAIAGDRLEACWALVAARGLRRGELAGLKWSAVNLERGELHISETLVVANGAVVPSVPKTDRGIRRIPLDAHLVAKLTALRDLQLKEREAAGDVYEDSGYVMCDELGSHWTPDRVTRTFERLVATTDLPRITVHGLRHTCATLMLKNGATVSVVAEVLGDSEAVVLDYYSHVLPGMAESAGEQLSAALFG